MSDWPRVYSSTHKLIHSARYKLDVRTITDNREDNTISEGVTLSQCIARGSPLPHMRTTTCDQGHNIKFPL